MSPPSDAAKRLPPRIVALSLLLAALAVGVSLTWRQPSRHTHGSPSRSPIRQLPDDPLAYVPPSARTLVVVDFNRLRGAPATRAWFDGASSTGASCQEHIARRVRTVALVLLRLPPEEFAFVAAGDLRPADLARCVPDTETTVRQGFVFTSVRSRRDGAQGGIVTWTPRGVVLVGAASVVEAMLDHAIDVARGRAPPPVFEALLPLVQPDAALWGLHRPHDDGPPHDPLAAVSASALSVKVTDTVLAEATLRCDDSVHARRVEEALLRIRREILDGDGLTQPFLRTVIERASVAVDGSDVRLRSSLNTDTVSALGTSVTEFVRRLVGAL